MGFISIFKNQKRMQKQTAGGVKKTNCIEMSHSWRSFMLTDVWFLFFLILYLWTQQMNNLQYSVVISSGYSVVAAGVWPSSRPSISSEGNSGSVVVENDGGSAGQLLGSSSSSSGQSLIPLQSDSLSMHEPSPHVNSFSKHSICVCFFLFVRSKRGCKCSTFNQMKWNIERMKQRIFD